MEQSIKVSQQDRVQDIALANETRFLRGEDGKDGRDGRDGIDGSPGADGRDGIDGKDGFSPTIDVSEAEGGFDVTVTDVNGEKEFFVPATASQPPVVLANISNGVRVIDAGLTYSRGVVEVRLIGDMIWVIDSGVYNFTSSFKAANNRTVLEFDLPKELSNRIHNVNGAFGTTGTISYFPALAYENVTYTTFNCQSYLKRSKIGEEFDTFQMVYTGLSAVTGGGLTGFHLKLPVFLA